MPITWKNVTQPSFSASNQLLASGNRMTQDAINAFGTQLKEQGQYNKKENTGKLLAQLSGISNLDNAAAQRQSIMDQWAGRNVDLAAGAKAGDDRIKLLQGNETFKDKQEISDFQIANQQGEFDLAQKAKKAQIGRANIGSLLDKQKYNENLRTSTPEYLAEQATLADEELKAERKHEKSLAYIKNKGKGGSSAEKRISGLIENLPNNLWSTTGTTQRAATGLNSEFSDISSKERERIFGKYLNKNWSKPFDEDAIRLELRKARLAKPSQAQK